MTDGGESEGDDVLSHNDEPHRGTAPGRPGKVRAGEFEEALALYDEALGSGRRRRDARADHDQQGRRPDRARAQRTGSAGAAGDPDAPPQPASHVPRGVRAACTSTGSTNEMKRAIFYGQIALDAADEAGEPFWKLAALNELGIIYVIDSQFEKAIECFEEALALLEGADDSDAEPAAAYASSRTSATTSCSIGETEEGLALVHSVARCVSESPIAQAEAYIDLCYGYLDLEQISRSARFYGEAGLELASEAASDPQRALPPRRSRLQGRATSSGRIPLRRAGEVLSAVPQSEEPSLRDRPAVHGEPETMIKRFLVALVLIATPLLAFADAANRAFLLTQDGTLFTVESAYTDELGIQSPSTQCPRSHHSHRQGHDNRGRPRTLLGGSHTSPALAYDAASKSLFIFWQRATSNGMSSDPGVLLVQPGQQVERSDFGRFRHLPLLPQHSGCRHPQGRPVRRVRRPHFHQSTHRSRRVVGRHRPQRVGALRDAQHRRRRADGHPDRRPFALHQRHARSVGSAWTPSSKRILRHPVITESRYG